MTPTEIIGLITGVLTVLGVIVTITRYLTQLQFRITQERLEAEKEAAEKRSRDLEARYQDLLNQLAIAKRVGTTAIVRKMAIDEELLSIMKVMRAQAGSILIPITRKASREISGLAFLSIQPLGEQSARLKRKIIPLQSSAGSCLRTGKPYASPDSKSDPTHYDKADLISGYRTEDMLNYPLIYQGEVIGVLQLLNKEGAERFTESDIPFVEPFAKSLTEKVAEFIYVPENFEILGFMQEREPEYATIMVWDLTQSSLLFRELGTSVAIQHINENFEKLCDIALRYGATVDKYIGDGVILKYNVPRRVKDHPYQAVAAAMEMKLGFERLKGEWLTMGEPLTGLYIRIVIAYGQVYEAVVGHPQYQYVTVFGQPVNVAINLCEAARRDRNVIIIDERAYRELSGKILAEQISREQMGKASSWIQTAYEVRGLVSEDHERGG